MRRIILWVLIPLLASGFAMAGNVIKKVPDTTNTYIIRMDCVSIDLDQLAEVTGDGDIGWYEAALLMLTNTKSLTEQELATCQGADVPAKKWVALVGQVYRFAESTQLFTGIPGCHLPSAPSDCASATIGEECAADGFVRWRKWDTLGTIEQYRRLKRNPDLIAICGYEEATP